MQTFHRLDQYHDAYHNGSDNLNYALSDLDSTVMSDKF
jgi:hypothetical protein